MKKTLPHLFSVIVLSAFSQGEMTLPMLEHVYQSSYYNPAAVPDHKVSIGLPGISSLKVGYIYTGNQLLNGFEKQNGKSVFNVGKLVSSMPANNYLHIGTQVDFFHLRIKWRNSFVSFDAGNTTEINTNIPKEFFQLATFDWTLPGTETGRIFDLSSFNAKVLSYNHYSFGLNKMLRNFNIGGRINLLQGLASTVVSSDNLKIGLTTGAITLNNSINVQTSGLNNLNQNTATQFKNLGVSVDLGVTYKYRERLFLGVSGNNIGFIDWKNDIENTKYYQDQAKGPFRGLDIAGPIIRGDSLNNVSFADTLKNYFSAGADSSNKRQAFRTWLTPRIYLSANYKITDKFSVSAMVKFEQYIQWRYALMLGVQYKLGRILSLAASSTYQYEKITLGGGIVIKPGPFQFYVVTDNIPFPLYQIDGKINGTELNYPLPLDAKMMNIRLGMNLVFGNILGPRKQAFNYKE